MWHLPPWCWAIVLKRGEFLVQTPSWGGGEGGCAALCHCGGSWLLTQAPAPAGWTQPPALLAAHACQRWPSPLWSVRAPRARVAARAEEAQALPVNRNDFCMALSISFHADISQVFQQTHLLAGMLADQQNLEYPGLDPAVLWAGEVPGMGKRGCVAMCVEAYLNRFGWCLWSRTQAGRPVPHSPWINLLMHGQKVESGYVSTRNHKAEAPVLDSWVHQVGKQNPLKCQCGTGEWLGAAWQHSSGRSQSGNTESEVKRGHPTVISCQMYLKRRLWRTSNYFLMKILENGTILLLAWLWSAQ